MSGDGEGRAMRFEPARENRAIDVEALRRFFPALAGDWTFLDNAGGSQIAQQSLDRLNEYLLTSNVQTGGSYGVSELATRRVDAAAAAVATMVNASGPEEVILGSSSTMLVRMLAESFGNTLQPGDEIIVSNVSRFSIWPPVSSPVWRHSSAGSIQSAASSSRPSSSLCSRSAA